ncbi:hypothetical protein BBJ28_00006609 [Nothophytophthora sp. Chile5]|nr:hypothetical protein BBJ28_00006609 [Nothophytophthora sp. Chile5]
MEPAVSRSPSRLELAVHSDSSDDSDASSGRRSLASSSSSSSSYSPPVAATSGIASYFRALRSPPPARGRRRRAQQSLRTSQTLQHGSQQDAALQDLLTPLSTTPTGSKIPLMTGEDAAVSPSPSPPHLRASTSTVGRTHGSRHSDAGSEPAQQHSRGWRRRAAPSACSAHSAATQRSCQPPTSLNVAELTSKSQSEGLENTALPSSNYYVDAAGQLRVRKLWWCYRRSRRAIWCLLPWLKRDSNTFLCARMLANSMLIVVVYLLRLLANHLVIPALLKHGEPVRNDSDPHCQQVSLAFLDMFAYSLAGNVLLCLPALNFKACRLYRRAPKDPTGELLDSTSSSIAASAVVTPAPTLAGDDKDQLRFEKTYLFTMCELIVVLEIPYLLYALVRLFLPSSGSFSVGDTLNACAHELAPGYFIVLLGVQLVAVVAYALRWRQILLFHRLHQHFLFQRGYVPGHSRFDYVERSFATPLYAWLPAPVWACWRRCKRLRSAARGVRTGGTQDTENSGGVKPKRPGNVKKQVRRLKVALYGAAKRGDVEQVRSLLDEAVSVAGPDFATAWYEPRVWKLGGFLLLARGQRNPLHVAVAFDQLEVVRELLANGQFDVQQLDKLELLRLDLAWLYRLMFRVLFFLVRRSSAGVSGGTATSGGGGAGGAAPGLASASHPFGPVGLLQSTLLSPLHVAVTLGHAELTLLLLRYGAKPDTPALSTHARFATAPLFWAVDKECTRLLLDADANPLALPTPGGASGLLLTAFEVARLAGNAAVARQMEKYGGDVALTPLHDACAGGRRHEVAFLLEHGADPDTLGEQVTGCFRRTPLHWAAMRGHARVLRVLLRYGASVDARDVFGRTALAWACVLNRANAVEMLLACGADVNTRDAQGDPLLCICAAGACASMKTGSKTAAGKRDKLGDDQVQDDYADDGGDDDAEAGGVLSGRRSLARGLDPRIFQLLLDSGVDLHATRTSNGDSALHVALRRRNQAAALLFVRAGLSLTAVNLLGERALECARSPALRFAVKKEAGHRDVMISYSHAHAPLARKLRDALERARVTTWIDAMGPTGITGGSVWRQEIARGIQSSALVLAVLTKDYPQSQWCMKELAFAKMQNVPVVAIQCEDMEISEELQVYLWTRQVIDFRPAVKHHHDSNAMEETTPPLSDDEVAVDRPLTSSFSHTQDSSKEEEEEDLTAVVTAKRVTSDLELVPDYNDDAFRHCLRLLLDGIQDQIEEHRVRLARREQQQQHHLRIPGAPAGGVDGRPCGITPPRRESRRDESEASSPEEDGTPAGDDHCTPRDCEASEASDDARDSEVHFQDQPPLRRPLRRVEALASSLTSAGADSFVFIAHGDYHRSFCLRVQKALTKQGVRCVVDQAIPAVQYTHQFQDAEDSGNALGQSGGFGADLSGANQQVTRLSVQTRQLAAKDAILACSAVLVVLSPLSASCDLLADQLAFAEDRGKMLVPILLSLHSVDLAKRYTFSRSLVHHFNASLGFEQSAQQLGNYLRAQQQTAARQRRLERRQQEQQELHGGVGLAPPLSPGSSSHSRPSSLPDYSAVMEVHSPYDDEFLYSTDESLLLPPLPVHAHWASMSSSAVPPAAPLPATTIGASTSSFGGHGWSETDVMEAARRDDAQLFQQNHLHLQTVDIESERRTASATSNASASSRTRSRGNSAPIRHQESGTTNSTEEIV